MASIRPTWAVDDADWVLLDRWPQEADHASDKQLLLFSREGNGIMRDRAGLPDWVQDEGKMVTCRVDTSTDSGEVWLRVSVILATSKGTRPARFETKRQWVHFSDFEKQFPRAYFRFSFANHAHCTSSYTDKCTYPVPPRDDFFPVGGGVELDRIIVPERLDPTFPDWELDEKKCKAQWLQKFGE